LGQRPKLVGSTRWALFQWQFETVAEHQSREDRDHKIRTRKQRRDIGKYSFVNRTIINWKQLPANLLASFLCKLNTFRNKLKKQVSVKVLWWLILQSAA
jgi:hypothetical protein